jgi:hypothetical protein
MLVMFSVLTLDVFNNVLRPYVGLAFNLPSKNINHYPQTRTGYLHITNSERYCSTQNLLCSTL